MNDRFVTVEVFASSLEANLAKNCLEDAGIAAYLVSENLVDMASVLGNAVGGVRLEVRDSDAPQASAILEGARRRRNTDVGASQVKGSAEPGDQEADEVEPPAGAREQDAERALKSAIVGLFFVPLQIYAFWLLMKVYFSDERLRKPYVWRTWLAGAINAPFVIITCFILWIFLVNLLNL